MTDGKPCRPFVNEGNEWAEYCSEHDRDYTSCLGSRISTLEALLKTILAASDDEVVREVIQTYFVGNDERGDA